MKAVTDALRKMGYKVDQDSRENRDKTRQNTTSIKQREDTNRTSNGTNTAVLDEIEREALKILTEGDPLAHFRKAFALLHSGDTDVLDVFVLAGCAQAALTCQGIQPAIAGHKGSGKTTAATAALHLFPEEFVVSTTFSSKALFYDENLQPGCVIFSDDTTLPPDLEGLVKRAMSSFQTGTKYMTVMKEGGKNASKTLFMPERTVFVFT